MRMCSPITLNCDICYSLVLPFGDIITVEAGLIPGHHLFLWVTDKFRNQYRVDVVTQSGGSFNIDTSEFPAFLFNPNGGTFDLFLSSDDLGLNIIPMSFDSVQYNCLKLKTNCDTPTFFRVDVDDFIRGTVGGDSRIYV